MKKILLSICITALLISCVGVIAFGSSVDVSAITMSTADKPTLKADDRLELSLDFYVLKDSMDYINANADDVKTIGLIAEYADDMAAPNLGEGAEISLFYSGETVINSKKHAVYTLNLGVFKPEEYMTKLAVRAFITFTLNGAPYTIASDFSAKRNTFSPYSAVYSIYTDRSATLTGEYKYETPDGSFSKIKDLDPLRKILASHLTIDIKNGRVIVANYGKYYDSLYDISYFDGVLTISMENSSIPECLPLYKEEGGGVVCNLVGYCGGVFGHGYLAACHCITGHKVNDLICAVYIPLIIVCGTEGDFSVFRLVAHHCKLLLRALDIMVGELLYSVVVDHRIRNLRPTINDIPP